ncbi:quinone oxidoreductase family protein [Sporolactobacillus putidus]|uniref:Quinone oxidoreductase n=1 Tax=Sporolactobacillus putidus TaxID=492735 RepID=A0A917RWT6_9BACL|nr:NAD(P)H-quinone oxidoreductase [Sporolactobacillus putidus]GGL43108.1 quinone oxidoreductase [Sporolactobacillus putidus]
MKTIVVSDFGGPSVLKVADTDTPSVGARQVLIRVVATSVNFADIMSRQGRYHSGSKPPFIPGLDAAGVIEKIGPDVRHLKPGQRVIALLKNGSYSEYVVSDENLTFPIPDNVDFETAAACPTVSFTSYKLLADVARLAPGETVLIHAAAGGIGTTAVQFARLLGAAQVIGTVGNDKKRGIALEAGADQVINYQTEDFAEKVKELTDGRGADIILDSISGDVAEKSLTCLAMYGRLVNFGSAAGGTGHFKTTDLHSSCRAVLGFSLGTTVRNRPDLLADASANIFRFLKEGRLKMKVGRHYALEEAAKAHEWMESRQSTGKIVLDVAK